MIVNSVLDLIGNTPIVSLKKLVESHSAEVLVKLEAFNPGGSIKDRIALGMLEAAEREGKIKPGSVLVEPTSGSTGIGLALVAAIRGYRLIIVMPENMSEERKKLLRAYGAELILTSAEKGIPGAVEMAERLVQENPEYFMPQQFNNPANPVTHSLTTAREILNQTQGKLDVFIAGAGTGGTLTGTAEILKKEIPDIKIVAVEPAESPVLSGGKPGIHKIQGIGPGFIPKVLNQELIDRIFTVTGEEAIETARRCAKEEGVLVGISSGAAIYAALEIGKTLGKGKRILAIAPDSGERYLSTDLY